MQSVSWDFRQPTTANPTVHAAAGQALPGKWTCHSARDILSTAAQHSACSGETNLSAPDILSAPSPARCGHSVRFRGCPRSGPIRALTTQADTPDPPPSHSDYPDSALKPAQRPSDPVAARLSENGSYPNCEAAGKRSVCDQRIVASSPWRLRPSVCVCVCVWGGVSGTAICPLAGRPPPAPPAGQGLGNPFHSLAAGPAPPDSRVLSGNGFPTQLSASQSPCPDLTSPTSLRSLESSSYLSSES